MLHTTCSIRYEVKKRKSPSPLNSYDKAFLSWQIHILDVGDSGVSGEGMYWRRLWWSRISWSLRQYGHFKPLVAEVSQMQTSKYNPHPRIAVSRLRKASFCLCLAVFWSGRFLFIFHLSTLRKTLGAIAISKSLWMDWIKMSSKSVCELVSMLWKTSVPADKFIDVFVRRTLISAFSIYYPISNESISINQY